MHLPWGMICFAGFQLYFPTFPSPLNTNSIFYQNKTHALRPCATNCHKILRTWCKNSIFCKTPNTLLQIQRAPTRARQSPSIPTVVATQSPTTKGHLHLHTSNTKPHPVCAKTTFLFTFSVSFHENQTNVHNIPFAVQLKPTANCRTFLPKNTHTFSQFNSSTNVGDAGPYKGWFLLCDTNAKTPTNEKSIFTDRRGRRSLQGHKLLVQKL